MSRDEPMEKLIDAEQLAEILQIPKQSIWRMAKCGVLPAYRFGRLLRFDFEEVKSTLRIPANEENGQGEE